MKTLAAISFVLFPMLAFGGTHKFTHQEIRYFRCLRDVIQHQSNDYKPNLNHQAMFDLIVAGITSQTLADGSAHVTEHMDLCQVLKTQMRMAPSMLTSSEKAGSELKAFLGDVSQPDPVECKGVILDANFAILIGASAGVGGHYCRHRDGRSGLYFGLNFGAEFGGALSVAALTQADFTSKGRMLILNTQDTSAANMGAGTLEDPINVGTEGYHVGPMFSLKSQGGAEIKVVPLGTHWQNFLRNYFPNR